MKFMKFEIIFIVIILLFTAISTLKTILNNRENMVLRLLCIVIFGITFWMMFQRDTYLPFLGYSALSPSVLKDSLVPENSNIETSIPINAENGTKILYWGAIPSKMVKPTPMAAYGDFGNSGVTYVHEGKAVFRFNCPSKYNVPWGMTLDRHIHYRMLLPDGILSPVKTVYVNC